MSSSKRTRADDFTSAKRLGWKPLRDRRAELGQAQSGAFQRIPARPFFHKLSALRHSRFKPRQLFHQFANEIGARLQSFADNERRVKSIRRDEIARLKFQSGKGQSMISNPSATQSLASSAAWASKLSPLTSCFKPKTISGSTFSERGCAIETAPELPSL